MAKLQKVPTASYHPGYGCAIFIIAILTFAGSLTWWIYSGYEEDRQISTFTVSEAPPLASAKPTAEEKTALKGRLTEYFKAVSTGQPAKLSFTVTDLNNLIVLAGEAGLVDNRGSLQFTGMDAAKQELQADLRWLINNLPFTDRKERFLVGKAAIKPSVDNNSLELHVIRVDVPGKTVVAGFMQNLQQLPLLGQLKSKPEIGGALAAISSFQITPEGTLVLDAKALPKPVAPAK